MDDTSVAGQEKGRDSGETAATPPESPSGPASGSPGTPGGTERENPLMRLGALLFGDSPQKPTTPRRVIHQAPKPSKPATYSPATIHAMVREIYDWAAWITVTAVLLGAGLGGLLGWILGVANYGEDAAGGTALAGAGLGGTLNGITAWAGTLLMRAVAQLLECLVAIEANTRKQADASAS